MGSSPTGLIMQIKGFSGDGVRRATALPTLFPRNRPRMRPISPLDGHRAAGAGRRSPGQKTELEGRQPSGRRPPLRRDDATLHDTALSQAGAATAKTRKPPRRLGGRTVFNASPRRIAAGT
jgi:hypothetical protein